jgi:pyruvate ferredoxin oxidoreductase alpha subunit
VERQRNKKTREHQSEGIFGVVRLQDRDTLTIKSVAVGDFSKSYLGEHGRQIARQIIREGTWQLKEGWESARFAAVTKNGSQDVFGLVAEYDDGTISVLAQPEAKAKTSDIETLNGLISQYLHMESTMPFEWGLRGWEEVTPGAVIRDKFTSRDTYTGSWAKEVAVFDPEKCNLCQQCAAWCPEDAIGMDPVTGKLNLSGYDYCKGCGICSYVCPPEAGAIAMMDEKLVKAAQPKVFDGIYGKRIEVEGDLVNREAARVTQGSSNGGYELVYTDTSGKKSLSGLRIVQCLEKTNGSGNGQRPRLHTFTSENGKRWKKIIRPLADILVYGMSAEDKTLASRLQADGFRITAIVSGKGGDFNKERAAFEGANIATDTTLESIVDRPDVAFDAVITAHHDAVTVDQDKLVTDKIGVMRTPFRANVTRDVHLEGIISELETTMPEPEMEEDDRPLALLMGHEGNVSSGHRLCAGCPVATAFNLVVKAVAELDPEIENIHSGATGCAEVATTIYPDTAWPSWLHTTFGGLGANLEGMDAAYRYLRKRGLMKKKLKFWGWAGDGGTYDIGLQALSGLLERGLAKDSVYFCYDNGAYMNTGIQRSSATPLGASTSTSPIGEVVPGKPQFRKDLEHIAGAHNNVYVAKVSPSHQIDFVNKVKKAVQHDGPALVLCYSNCTTGHRTETELTTEQSRLAVECGFWPLLEIDHGETRLSQPEPSAYNPRISAENKVTLLEWVKSEGRFAQHFDRAGNFASREHEMQVRELERQLLIAWRKLQAEDKLTRRKDRLMEELTKYLQEQNERRLKDLTTKPHLFGISGYTQDYIDELSWLDEGGKPKPFLQRVLQNVRRTLDPDEHKLKDPKLAETLYGIFVREYKTLIEDQRALQREKVAKVKVARDAKKALDAAGGSTMDEGEKQLNRAIVGSQPLSGRIFARAGDGGVTAAKVFVSLLKETGLFGKAAPDYGPERRGAPVGTNFAISGKELRTQASFPDLFVSVVVNPDDMSWPIGQWRDQVVEGGIIVMNTSLSAAETRQRHAIPGSVAVVVTDASATRNELRVPETVTLLAGVLKALVAHGVGFDQDYLVDQWKRLLTKEFADKANMAKIVQSNMDAFWNTYENAELSPSDKAEKVNRDGVDTSGFDQSPPQKLMTGSEAVAEAWRQINPGVFAMFPITPSTEVGQTFSQFWADGKVDTEFVHTESEHSSFMAIIAATASGVRAVTSSASQGMLLGKEGGSLAASLRLPVVVNVGARETNAPLNIHAGHTDFYQFRDDGWIHFMPRNAQQAYDFSLIAQKAAEKAELPAFINQDGFIVTHNKDMLDTLTDEEVQAFVGEYDPEFCLLKTGGTYNPVALQDYYSEHVRTLSEGQKALPGVIDDVCREFAELTGRHYARSHAYQTDDARVVVVTMGSTEGTAMDAVDEMRANGMKVGLFALKTFRPFPCEEMRTAAADADTIIVMDRANCHGAELTPLAIEVQAAVGRPVLSIEYGRGGRNTPLSLVKDVYELGFLLGSRVDGEEARMLFSNPDAELQALLGDLEILEGTHFVERFVRDVIAGRLIQAFGPWEHIDVRETKRRREIKLRVIAKAVTSPKLAGVEVVEPRVG